MDERSKALAKNIESGEYFTEAKDWYNKLYLYTLKDASIMTVIACIFVLAALITAFNVNRVFPLTEQVKVVVPLENTLKFFPKLIKKGYTGRPFKQVVINALTTRYVESRESYIPERLNVHYMFVLNNSSKEIFDKYYKALSSTEPNNPLKLYLNGDKAKVEILEKNSDKYDNKATIIFNKRVYSNLGTLKSVSKWKAEIDFYLSDYDFSNPTTSKLDFIVTKYQINKLEDHAKEK